MVLHAVKYEEFMTTSGVNMSTDCDSRPYPPQLGEQVLAAFSAVIEMFCWRSMYQNHIGVVRYGPFPGKPRVRTVLKGPAFHARRPWASEHMYKPARRSRSDLDAHTVMLQVMNTTPVEVCVPFAGVTI